MAKQFNHFEYRDDSYRYTLKLHEGSTLTKDFIKGFTNDTLRAILGIQQRPHKGFIFSHNDPDGHASGAVMLFHDSTSPFEDNNIFNIDYNYDFSTSIDEWKDADIIYITDLSLNQKQIDYIIDHSSGIIVWIDHHESSKYVENSNPKRLYKFIHSEIGISAVCLSYLYVLFMSIINGKFPIKLDHEVTLETIIPNDLLFLNDIKTIPSIPSIITQISLYDTFDDDMSLDFIYGLQTEFEMNINSDVGLREWRNVLYHFFDNHKGAKGSVFLKYTIQAKEFENQIRIMNHIMEVGKYVHRYTNIDYAKHRKTMLGEFILTVVDTKTNTSTEYNMASLNMPCFSMGFGPYLQTADGCIRYYQTKDGKWTYSCYSNKDSKTAVPCDILAKHFGGGGHKNAAGWSADKNIVAAWLGKNTTIYI